MKHDRPQRYTVGPILFDKEKISDKSIDYGVMSFISDGASAFILRNTTPHSSTLEPATAELIGR